jgi:hypothetical protein
LLLLLLLLRTVLTCWSPAARAANPFAAYCLARPGLFAEAVGSAQLGKLRDDKALREALDMPDSLQEAQLQGARRWLSRRLASPASCLATIVTQREDRDGEGMEGMEGEWTAQRFLRMLADMFRSQAKGSRLHTQ